MRSGIILITHLKSATKKFTSSRHISKMVNGTMKAAVIKEFGKPVEVCQIPIPQPKKNEILIKIAYSGICGTDHHAWKGDWPVKPTLPFIPGHEGVGRIVEVGSEVKHLKEGDLVGVPWLYNACSHCEQCFAGWETLCKDQNNAGYSVNGTLAEYVIGDPNYVARVPEGVDLAKVAPVLCAGVTVYKGLKVTEAKAGQWVLVSGLGGLGQLGVQFAKAMGYNVIGVDIDDAKLETAKKLGAAYAFNGMTQDIGKEIQNAVGGVHGCIVTAVGRAAFGQALTAIRQRGTMVCIGIPPGDFPLDIFNTVMNGITVRGSIVGTRVDMMEALEFFRMGKIENNVQLETIDKIDEVMTLMDQGKLPGRVVFDFTK